MPPTTTRRYVVMCMNGTLTELMAKTDSKLYRNYLTDEKGKKVLYLCLQKASYGMVKSAFLLYRKLISGLKGMGFEVNPYDPCVVNKMVNSLLVGCYVPLFHWRPTKVTVE